MSQPHKKERLTAALSYVSILFLIPLSKRNSTYCQFHAKQGVVLFLLWIPISVMAWIPVFGWVGWAFLLLLNITAIVKALNGKMWVLPFVGHYAKFIKL